MRRAPPGGRRGPRCRRRGASGRFGYRSWGAPLVRGRAARRGLPPAPAALVAGRAARAPRCGAAGRPSDSRGDGSVVCGMPIAPTKCSWNRGSMAVSIFSTRRTTSSISARAARFNSAIRAPVPAALPADVTWSGSQSGTRPEDQRVDGIDVGAERAGQADAVDRGDPQVVHQQPASCVERRLRELDLPHVVLRDDQAWRRRRAARRRTSGRPERSGACGPRARRRSRRRSSGCRPGTSPRSPR